MGAIPHTELEETQIGWGIHHYHVECPGRIQLNVLLTTDWIQSREQHFGGSELMSVVTADVGAAPRCDDGGGRHREKDGDNRRYTQKHCEKIPMGLQ
jgi:hypothetical protein